MKIAVPRWGSWLHSTKQLLWTVISWVLWLTQELTQVLRIHCRTISIHRFNFLRPICLSPSSSIGRFLAQYNFDSICPWNNSETRCIYFQFSCNARHQVRVLVKSCKTLLHYFGVYCRGSICKCTDEWPASSLSCKFMHTHTCRQIYRTGLYICLSSNQWHFFFNHTTISRCNFTEFQCGIVKFRQIWQNQPHWFVLWLVWKWNALDSLNICYERIIELFDCMYMNRLDGGILDDSLDEETAAWNILSVYWYVLHCLYQTSFDISHVI